MLSVDANEMEFGMETRSSKTLAVPKIRKSQSRAMSKLEKAGKNDSVKSTYSLSVFIDPNASRDMGRQEELWYTMYEPERPEGGGDADKTRLLFAKETESLKGKGVRNDFESVAFVNSQQTSDNERFFSKNAVTVGAGTGVSPGKNSESDSEEFRRNSRETREENAEENRDENSAEEAMRARREVLTEAPRQGHRQHGSSNSSSSIASEASEEHNHRHPRDYVQGHREDVEHANSESGTEEDDDQVNEWQTDARNYGRSRHAEYEENAADEQRTSEVRTFTGQEHSNAKSANERGAVTYQSNMQERHSTGYLRQRTGSSKAAHADDTNSSILTKQIDIDYRGHMVEDADEENAYLTLTEGSDEDQTARSTHREVAKNGRRRIVRATPADAGDAAAKPTRYESLSGDGGGVSTSANSAPRNHSSVAAHDEEFSSSHQRRKRSPIARREKIQRTGTTQGEAQDSSQDTAATPTEQPSTYIRASGDDDDDDEVEHLNSISDKPIPATRVKSSQGADSVQRPAQMYSSEEEEEYGEEIVRRRQGTNLGESEGNRFGRQTTSDEENEIYEVINSRRDISTNRRPSYNSTSSSRNTSDAQDYEMYNPNAQRNLKKSTYYDNNNASRSDHQPRPTPRTKLGIHDSLSSMDYSSSTEAYHPKTYNRGNIKARSTKDADFGSADNQPSYQDFEDQSSRNTGYAQGRGFYPDSAVGPPIQPQKGVRQNPARVAGTSSESSLSQEQRSQYRRRPIVNDQGLYSDESESDDHSTRTGQKVVVDFGSESDSSSAPRETENRRKSRTTTTKTTVVRSTATPVRGVLTVDETVPPQRSPVAVRRETRTVTTPVTGVVSFDDSASAYRHRKTSPMTRTTPVEGLISVHRQSHSRQERTKTPVVGLITPRESQTHTAVRSSTVTTPVRGVINVGRTPSPERSKTPVVGLISTRRSRSSTSINQTTPGDINVITSRSVRNQPAIASTIKSELNDIYRQPHLYPRQMKYSLNTSIDSVLVPTATPDSKEIVGVDPELRRAQKTGTNYRITMNLRPVIDDVTDVGYEEMHNAMGRLRSATPNSVVRSNSRRANDWDLNSEYTRSASRSSNPMTINNTLGSRRSVSRIPRNQFGYESNANTGIGPYSAWEGNAVPLRRSSSLYQEQIIRPDSQGAYRMDSGRGDTLADPRAWVNRPAAFQEVSRKASSTLTDWSRPRSTTEQRNDLLFPQPQIVHVKPIHQTVTSRPIRGNFGQDRLTVKGPPGRAFNGGQMMPKSHSSSMSSVFLSPTLDRRFNRNARVHRNDTYQRIGQFN